MAIGTSEVSNKRSLNLLDAACLSQSVADDINNNNNNGVGIRGGCEAAIHSARRYLQTLAPDHVMVKLDFANAFNSLHRSDMLLSVRDCLPELYAFCLSSYSQPSFLYFGSHVLLSEEGPQQGDPLGPLLFCTTIHPLISSMGSDLTLGYLD